MSDVTSLAATSKVRHQFSFSGSGKEYFGIWIVNLLLSIVTLGIYTAWAKVRRLRYFYGNTWLDGHNFEYHAKPLQILLGRIIAIILFAILNVAAELFPIAALAFFLLYLIVLPWFINMAIQFNSRMTSYRNVRLGFKGRYLKALWIFVILPFAPIVLLGALAVALYFTDPTIENSIRTLNQTAIVFFAIFGIVIFVIYLVLIPYISKLTNEYIANNLKFGTAKFSASIEMKSLYKNIAVAILPLVAIIVLVALIAWVSTVIVPDRVGFPISIIQLSIFPIYIGFFVTFIAYSAGVRNIAYNATTLDEKHSFDSNVPRFGYAWVLISNLFISVITIGLAIPWTAVRTWRYLANHTVFVAASNLESFTADQSEQGNVAAAEYLDLDGVDFGL